MIECMTKYNLVRENNIMHAQIQSIASISIFDDSYSLHTYE